MEGSSAASTRVKWFNVVTGLGIGNIRHANERLTPQPIELFGDSSEFFS
jgi:hypothetical protein